jgi:hypothetical protein
MNLLSVSAQPDPGSLSALSIHFQPWIDRDPDCQLELGVKALRHRWEESMLYNVLGQTSSRVSWFDAQLNAEQAHAGGMRP